MAESCDTSSRSGLVSLLWLEWRVLAYSVRDPADCLHDSGPRQACSSGGQETQLAGLVGLRCLGVHRGDDDVHGIRHPRSCTEPLGMEGDIDRGIPGGSGLWIGGSRHARSGSGLPEDKRDFHEDLEWKEDILASWHLTRPTCPGETAPGDQVGHLV